MALKPAMRAAQHCAPLHPIPEPCRHPVSCRLSTPGPETPPATPRALRALFSTCIYPCPNPCSYFVVCHLSTLNCCCNVQAMIEGNLPLSLGAVAGAAAALLL